MRKKIIGYEKFQSVTVKKKFDAYPQSVRPRLLFLRSLIFKVASQTPNVGDIEETLKWGEPSYVTYQTQSGSTVRIDWKKSSPEKYYIYFNCKTTLVATFKEIYGNIFHYESNRCLMFHKDEEIPLEELTDCILMALTYHLTKKGK